MKKIVSIIWSAMLITLLFLGCDTKAEDADIAVELDGSLLTFDVSPTMVEDRTMVPLRKIFEEIGAMVKWNEETQTVSARKSAKTVTLTIGASEMQIDQGKTDENGNPLTETVSLEVPAQILSGRTLVPLRAVAESFGVQVDWDEENQKVILTSKEAKDNTWKQNSAAIDLTHMTMDGTGATIDGKQITITDGGDYTITGSVEGGSITVLTKERVKLRLSGASMTSLDEKPCIMIEEADKAYITLTEGTENVLIAHACESGAIVSKENLEIKGGGTLYVTAKVGHAIKASDNLTVEEGTLKLTAAGDGMHINDTFTMKGGAVSIIADGDGIDSESIVDIAGGSIQIETHGVPTETSVQEEQETIDPRGRGGEASADVEFAKSSKGINAEWMMRISGGDITVSAASHAIHCQDEIEINGGRFTLASQYEKGVSAHGNLTIRHSDTVIDITQATEGLESKNILTIYDGTIKINATDDAINATGGNSGVMMGPRGNQVPPQKMGEAPKPPTESEDQPAVDGQRPQGHGRRGPGEMGENGVGKPPEPSDMGERPVPPFEEGQNGKSEPKEGMPRPNDDGGRPGGFGGGMGREMKDCLVIYGGNLELCAKDDCLDSNGNLLICGGTIKAVKTDGTFSGNFGVLDADGQTVVSETATLLLAAGQGHERDIALTQNTIIVYAEKSHKSGDVITVSDADGRVIYAYAPTDAYQSVLIASADVKMNETYVVQIGDEIFKATVTEQSTVVGSSSAVTGFGHHRE